MYKNRKVYQDGNTFNFFWYNNGKKTYLQGEKENFIKYIKDNKVGFQSTSAYEYYKSAYDFSTWLINDSGLKDITQENMEDSLKKISQPIRALSAFLIQHKLIMIQWFQALYSMSIE